MVAMALVSISAAPEARRAACAAPSGVCVCDIMSWPALSISATTTVARAETIAADQSVHQLVIVHRRCLIGLLCMCDIRDAEAASPVTSCMTRRVVTVHPDAPLTHAAELMDEYNIDCLPSRWMGALGIITRGDLVRRRVWERRICIACGSTHHVRGHPRYAGLYHCVDCLSCDVDKDGAPLYRDLRGGECREPEPAP